MIQPILDQWNNMAFMYRYGSAESHDKAKRFYATYWHLFGNHLNTLAVERPGCYDFEGGIYMDLLDGRDPKKSTSRRVINSLDSCVEVISKNFGG